MLHDKDVDVRVATVSSLADLKTKRPPRREATGSRQ